MGNYPLTEAFIRVIENTAKRNGAKRISRMSITMGKDTFLRGNIVVYLEKVLQGTAAKGAEIYIKGGNTAQRCICCGLVFSGEKSDICPECRGVSEAIALEGSFIIDMMEIER